MSFEKIQFPVVKNIQAKTILNELPSVQPMTELPKGWKMKRLSPTKVLYYKPLPWWKQLLNKIKSFLKMIT